MGLLNRLSIQSKLLLVLLGASVLSILVVGTIGYISGREAIVGSLRNQLSGICQVKSNVIKAQLQSIKGEVIALSADNTCVDALKSFKTAFADLKEKQLAPAWDQELAKFYEDVFLTEIRKTLDAEPVLETYLPRSTQSRYLQHQYIAANPHPYLFKEKLTSTGDGTAYDAAHIRFHDFFRLVKEKCGYEDVMLVDVETGDVIYSVQKTTEFSTNLLHGPYSSSNLALLFREIVRSNDRDDYRIVDFERYRPNLNVPASFIGSPVFDENKMLGVLVFQFPIDKINRAMTGGENWRGEGLGKTGEAYLVGSDLYMRSRSRFLWDAKEEGVEALKASGASAEKIEQKRKEGIEKFLNVLKASGATAQSINRLRQAGTAILNLRVSSEAAQQVLAGKTDTIFQNDYRGVPTIASFTPVELENMIGSEKGRWGLVSKMDISEAMAPVYEFRRRVLTSSVVIMLIVTLLALVFSRIFTQPIQKLAAGARKLSEGEADVQVSVSSRDEFRELADAFNQMTRNLKSKNDLIEQKIRENEDLLLNILPSAAAKRHKGGEKQFSDKFADVTVLFADIEGLGEMEEGDTAHNEMATLNLLVVAFDEAAERHGVEKVKTVGASYMAVCGLSIQRPDHTNRMVEFAKELFRIIRRLAKDRGVSLSLQVAINTGPVVGGVVGTNKFIYDLWGDTVTIARGLKVDGAANAILVTSDVQDRLGDLQDFEPRGDLEIRGKGKFPVWSVKI